MTKLEKALELALATHLLPALRDIDIDLRLDRNHNTGDIIAISESDIDVIFVNLTELAKAIANEIDLRSA